MNAKQKNDAQLQELNVWLIGKRNEIRRKKDAIAKEKLNELEDEAEDYFVQKRAFIIEIDNLRKQKTQCTMDDPLRYAIEDEARHQEQLLSLLRTEHEKDVHRINNEHMAKRMELDDEDRKLTEDYEQQKTAIMLEYFNSIDESRASDPEHEAE